MSLALWRVLMLIPGLGLGLLAWWAGLQMWSATLLGAALSLALQLREQTTTTVDQSGTRLLSMPGPMLQVKQAAVEQDLRMLAASLDLQRGVFEAASELVSCVEEIDARNRFLATLGSYWNWRAADLFIWERGRWRTIGQTASGPEPQLTAAVRLPSDTDHDLLLDLSPGVDGQAALVLRDAAPLPGISEYGPGDQRYIAEVLRGLLALSLRRVMLYQRLQKLGRIDPLTTLFRRWYGERRLHELVEEGHVVSLVMIDIDHFKQINDSHGHATGDAVLRGLGRHLRLSLRTGDICCRWGGEEFLILLPHTAGAIAVQVGERLCTSVRELEDLPCRVRVSVGVASCHRGEAVADLVQRVDAALYEAKHQGRDGVVQHRADRRSDAPIRDQTTTIIRRNTRG